MPLDIPTSSPEYNPEGNRRDPVLLPAVPAESEANPTGQPRPIDLLVPDSPLHTSVLGKLTIRLKASEDRMSQFHSRWQINERRFMAYINTQDFEKMLKESNKKGDAPSAVSITVPYIYATVWTIVTYLVHTFVGRKPIFQVGSYSAEAVEPARKMETLLQFGADRTKLVRKIFQWMMDGQIYGVGIVRNLWTVEQKMRTVQTQGSPLGPAAPGLLPEMMLSQKQPYVCYEGNDVHNIDPFNFFPDPRVPMEEVNKRGEFVFWRSFEGIHLLKKAELSGLLQWVDAIGAPGTRDRDANASNRDILTAGEASPGSQRTGADSLPSYHQLDQGTVELIPLEWGLGKETDVQKWLFTIANKKQIIQAEPFEDEHGRHPVAVVEPASIGYGFGQLSIVDMLGPLQDILSWFINSHVHNVRSSLNNMLVVDPSFVEIQDLKTPGPGKLIRLKATAMGRDVRTIVNQLQVADVTGGHIGDMRAFMSLADMLSGVNDSLRGEIPEGSRISATQSRISSESGGSRLAAIARMASAQGLTELGEMQASNIQQYQSMEFYLRVVGLEGILTPINPNDVQGDFYFPIHDGSLPLDKVAMLTVWKEIWLAVSTNAVLSQNYNGPAIFEHVAELGGAQNLAQYRVQIAPVQQQGPPGGTTPVGLPGTRGGSGEGRPS